MGFYEDVLELSQRFSSIKDQIKTEEATKMSMVVPFFQLLGYDVFNPQEFCPEFTADVGVKRGERVDYAIMQDDEPTILIECKWCGDSLDKHGSQLFRYFSTTPAKFGILTNGITYRFYTDLDEVNKMDLTPFLEINMLEPKENLIAELKKFCKNSFDKDNIFSIASELKYTNPIKDLLKSELDNPSEQFVRLIISSIYEGQKNQKVIEKFTPIVKKSFASFINEIMNQKITSVLNSNNEEAKENTSNENEEQTSDFHEKNKIITTQAEIESFFIIRGMLAGVVNVEDVVYRDTESYFAILYKDNNRKPICRLNLDTKRKQLLVPDESKNFERIYIDSLNDIYTYKDKIVDVVKRYIE